jgi:nucleotide-binding universal stress UspA family protein
MRILVAVDGSPQSQSALERLVDMFRYFRDAPKLTLLHVHPPVPYRAAAAWVGREAIERYYQDESEGALAGAAAFLSARGLPFRSERRVGDPAEEIVKFASEEPCDMIAMGTHGHTGLATLVMGSVATKVVAASKVPVLLVK